MNYRLIFIFLLSNLTVFSQQDSLIITTNLSADSIYVSNQKVDFSTINDSILKMQVDRNNDSIENKLVIYSGNKIYETPLPVDPVTTFHAEWTTRDPKHPLKIRMALQKGNWVLIRADGSAVNSISPLIVYSASGELILKESYGVSVYEKKKKNSKRKTHG